jgi:hypothetical protein
MGEWMYRSTFSHRSSHVSKIQESFYEIRKDIFAFLEVTEKSGRSYAYEKFYDSDF